jgi:hypothetical protein
MRGMDGVHSPGWVRPRAVVRCAWSALLVQCNQVIALCARTFTNYSVCIYIYTVDTVFGTCQK